jgi:hypothetical protein
MGIADSPLRDHVIFVRGVPRSGTTWLVTLLATHAEIAGVDAESHLFDFGVDHLFDNLERRDPNLHGLQSYLDREELADLVRDLCDGVLKAMRSHVSVGAEPPFVVEKTPFRPAGARLALARQRECYPDGWYVHIVRDREAVIRSLMRAPWLADRSYAACARIWDETVGHARETLGDLERYREVSYEELVQDPAQACAALFDWLGVDSGEDALDRVRILSREKYSEHAPLPVEPARPAIIAPRRLLSRARAAIDGGLRQAAGGDGREQGDSDFGYRFVQALREHDAETLRSLTEPKLDVVFHSPDGDLSARGDDGREALMWIGKQIFARRYVSEWCVAAQANPSWTIFFAAIGGDATRVDLAFGLELEDELLRSVVVVSAGPLGGRPATRLDG